MSGHGVARVGLDSAGGIQLGGGVARTRVGGGLVSVLGDAVAGHGTGPHASPIMAEGSPRFRINGLPVVRAGHLATCGHAATGTPGFRIEGSQ